MAAATAGDIVTRRYLISGRVQGVGFRWFVLRHAQRLRLRGYAQNLPDGRVEVVASGSPADHEALEEVLRRGPDRARVDRIDISPVRAAPYVGFEIR